LLLVLPLPACCNRGGDPSPSSSSTPSEAAEAPSASSAPAPPPAPIAPDGLPVNIPTARTQAPNAVEWNAAPPLRIPSARANNCEVHMIREWVRVNCGNKRRGRGTPDGVQVRQDCTRDTYTSMRGHANLVTALSPGHRCEVEFSWTDGKETFVAEWQRGNRPSLSFLPATAPAASSSAPANGRPLRLPVRRLTPAPWPRLGALARGVRARRCRRR